MITKFPIDFYFDGKHYRGEIKPLATEKKLSRFPTIFQIYLNHTYRGEIKRRGFNWETNSPACAMMMDVLGNCINDWYV
jgi:hypothetical protein